MDRPADPPSAELPLADELPPPAPEDSGGSRPPLAEAPPRHPTTPPPPRASAYRLLANLAVGFVCLFLFVRVAAVEPFGVPTGSMAPALTGNHRAGPCPRCGYPVRVGFPTGGGARDHFAHVGCPNCGHRFSLADARDLNGDRLLVDKNVFNVRRPRRWEMAVFHCPDTDPKEFRRPYVKRVLGLPGETITVLDGEVYADGELTRKGLAELRETRVPVFDLSHLPDPGGWNVRFLVEPAENDPRLPPTPDRHPEPADESVLKGGELTLDATGPRTSAGVTYRHFNLDDRKEEPVRAWTSYDGVPRSLAQLPAAHDFSVEFQVEVVTAGAEASFAVRLLDGADAVHAEVSVGPRAGGRAGLGRDGHGPLGAAGGVALEPGRTYRVEFSFVDRRVILAVDGRVVVPPADLPPAAKRNDVRRPLQLGARGCRLVVRDLRLYRDVHYTQFGEHGTQPPHGRPAVLGPAEYFMLGDNSANSQDSRKWPSPGVPEAEFIGKPFLIHQPLRPARMTLGGREREFQTVDWARLRWLH
jgi:signal peptidase I